MNDNILELLTEALADKMQERSLKTAPTAPYGSDSDVLWTDWVKAVRTNRVNPNEVRVSTKETSLSAPPSARLYTCTGLFGLCGPDDIIGLSMNDDPLISWIGFFPDTVCEKFIKMWSYFDVSGTAAGSISTTVYGDACSDPPTVEYDQYEVFIGDFGTLRACGQTVNISEIGLRKCDKQPTYTLPIEGVGPVRINNDLDLETIAAAQTVKHEMSREVITGDKDTTGQFDGLTNLVKTGYYDIKGNRRYSFDSVVVDWENDTLGGAVNGHGSIITKVRDVWRQIMWRINAAGMGKPREADVALVMPTWMSWEFLDEWAFWSFKEQTTGGDQVVYRDVYELRAYRDKYGSGGAFGNGYITIDGFTLSILAHDWMTVEQNAPNFCTDIYVLVRQIGTRRILQGQYIPADAGVGAVSAQAGYRLFNVETIQGNRGIKWMKHDNVCVSPCVLFRPRLYLDAPWACGVIQNVCANPQFDPQSLDPQSNYFIEDTKSAAEAITQYWYNSDTGSWFS